jgi:DNA ligase (NAD+)
VIAVDKAKRTGVETSYSLPERCPSCGQPVVRTPGEAALRCTNRDCPAQVEGAVLHFSRRFAMDIDHLGESLVNQLVGAGLVKSVADLYQLTEQELMSLERMGKKSALNVLSAISNSKNQTFDRLLTGLGIDLIGQVAAGQLAEELGSLNALLSEPVESICARAADISGFGPKMVESLRAYLENPSERQLLERLRDLEVSRAQVKKAALTDGTLSGKSFCVTGVLSRKRADIHADIEAHGGTVHESIKKGTTYLVCGEKVGQSKLSAAKKHGTQVVSEAELMAFIDN